MDTNSTTIGTGQGKRCNSTSPGAGPSIAVRNPAIQSGPANSGEAQTGKFQQGSGMGIRDSAADIPRPFRFDAGSNAARSYSLRSHAKDCVQVEEGQQVL